MEPTLPSCKALLKGSILLSYSLRYLSKLCQGSKGPCIWFEGSWLTPNEFQYISGRETAKVINFEKINFEMLDK